MTIHLSVFWSQDKLMTKKQNLINFIDLYSSDRNPHIIKVVERAQADLDALNLTTDSPDAKVAQ